MHAQPGTLGKHEELRVEEPGLVADLGQQQPGDVGAHRLEAALSVPKPDPQNAAEDQVVRARDELALRAPRDARPAGKSAPDGNLAVTRKKGRDERQEGVQVGRQVDVRVRDDGRLAGEPGLPERPAAPLLVEVEGADAGHRVGQSPGDHPGGVGAGVVRDRDRRGERETVIEVGPEPAHTGLEVGLLVVHRDDDVDDGRRRRCRANGPGVHPRVLGFHHDVLGFHHEAPAQS